MMSKRIIHDQYEKVLHSAGLFRILQNIPRLPTESLFLNDVNSLVYVFASLVRTK